MPGEPSDDTAQRWDAYAVDRPRPRWKRRLSVAGSALTLVVIALAATVYVGSRLGANEVKVPGRVSAVGGTGEVLYLNNCAQCHGPAGEGGQQVKGPAFTAGGALHELTFEERVAKISRGKPLRGMPRWKFQISEEDIRRIAAYTQVLSGTDPDPRVQGVR
ncbi:MAG TPA: cytochrome c [Mycobacteriales bacterium]|nr:cytochrome c [Mycobacteriales bacterium]